MLPWLLVVAAAAAVVAFYRHAVTNLLFHANEHKGEKMRILT